MNKAEPLFTKEQITQISFDELLVFKEAYMLKVQKHPILFPSHDSLIDQLKFLKSYCFYLKFFSEKLCANTCRIYVDNEIK